MEQCCLMTKYNMISHLGTGSFGEVYIAIRIKDGKEIAAKVEASKINSSHSSRLINEYRMYKSMRRHGFTTGLPKIYDFIQTPQFNIMTMQLLGKNLNDIYMLCNKKFHLETVFAIGIQLVTIMEKMHESGYIHRDIKPNNFLVGKQRPDKIFITDFGLSKKYIDHTGNHIKQNDDATFVGTVRYASLNVHHGIEPSRRDDLESIGYMLIFFLLGFLPWQGLGKDKSKDEMILTIGKVKRETDISELCQSLPSCFKDYIYYCRNLQFNDKPSYKFLRDLFKNTARSIEIVPHLEWIE